MFGGILASNTNDSHVREDAWPRRNPETVNPCRQSARRHGGERPESESAPFNRAKSCSCRHCFETEDRLGVHVDIRCVDRRQVRRERSAVCFSRTGAQSWSTSKRANALRPIGQCSPFRRLWCEGMAATTGRGKCRGLRTRDDMVMVSHGIAV